MPRYQHRCYAFVRRAWVSVCSVSVFTTKTSGVQHQIQDALVVFVGQLNLVLHLFLSCHTSLVAAEALRLVGKYHSAGAYLGFSD
jgi:hypothetical protein